MFLTLFKNPAILLAHERLKVIMMERKVLVDVSGILSVLSLGMAINGQSKAAIFIAIGLMLGSSWCVAKNWQQIKQALKVGLSVLNIVIVSYYLLFNQWVISLALIFAMHSYVWTIYWINARKDNILRVALMQVAEISLFVTLFFALIACILPVNDFFFYQLSVNATRVRFASILFITYSFGMNDIFYLINRKQMISALSKKIKPYNG